MGTGGRSFPRYFSIHFVQVDVMLFVSVHVLHVHITVCVDCMYDIIMIGVPSHLW